jgi:hypothetical protein
MKKFRYIATVLFCGSMCFGQTVGKIESNSRSETNRATLQQKLAASRELAVGALIDNSCAFTFSSGSGKTSLEYCVSGNGNIPELQAPIGHSLISSDRGEGYGICDIAAGGSAVAYSDYSTFGDSGNWGPATVVSHTATSVKIARTTADGIWTLTQTITQVPSTSSAKIVMTLKNNTSVTRVALLLRYVDVDVNGATDNNFDGTLQSAFAWNTPGLVDATGFGLIAQNVGPLLGVDSLGFGQGTFAPPNTCRPTVLPGPFVSVDGSLVLLYETTIPGSGSHTVTISYKGL